MSAERRCWQCEHQKTTLDGTFCDKPVCLHTYEKAQVELARLRALLRQCAIVIRKVQEEDNFYLPDEVCGNSWDEQLAFIDRIEDAAGRGEGL